MSLLRFDRSPKNRRVSRPAANGGKIKESANGGKIKESANGGKIKESANGGKIKESANGGTAREPVDDAAATQASGCAGLLRTTPGRDSQAREHDCPKSRRCRRQGAFRSIPAPVCSPF
jgi:hypothetical protein